MKAAWSQSLLGRVDLAALAKKLDPEVLIKASKDPDLYKAFQVIMGG